MAAEEIGEHASFTEMIVNFFTSADFVGLLSRRAMLPLIVFSILFGFAVQMTGGKDSSIGKWLAGLSDVMMKFVQIITYYAPIAFFAIFADLVATYGSEVAKGYGRALLVYYPLCFIYIFTAFPLFAWFGGGKGAVEHHVQAHRPPCRRLSGHLLLRGNHPHQHGGSRGDRCQQGYRRYGAAPGRYHAHGRLLLLLRAEDRLRAGRVRRAALTGPGCPSSFWWPSCPPWV